ncbi:hypothetical protein ACCS68_34995 [Rhizobium beringeri]|uniref:hypothetical protein n=1 Tax=Rhizobium beringeri TaxID=3019934 RepID=UPI003CFA5539
MPSLAQMTGSLHIHQFYIGKLKAKQNSFLTAIPNWRCFSTMWLPFCPSTLKSWLATSLTWTAMIDSAGSP